MKTKKCCRPLRQHFFVLCRAKTPLHKPSYHKNFVSPRNHIDSQNLFKTAFAIPGHFFYNIVTTCS